MAAKRFYQFGRFRFDPSVRQLFRDSQPVSLQPKAADVLLLLLKDAGNLLQKEYLLKAVWPETVVEEGSLTRAISVLRKALGDGVEGPEFIATVSKRGYRFVAPVTLMEDAPPPAQPSIRAHGLSSHPWALVLATVAALVLAFGSYLRWHRSQKPAAQGRLRLVVLPVQNLTGDPGRDYIADGLTEQIIAELSGYNPDRLGVIARTSALAYSNSNKTVQQIAAELRVDYLVESSLRAQGDQLRITSQLVRARDQTHVWTATYDRGMRNLLNLEDEVAQALAMHIGVELQSADRSRLGAARPTNPDAYLAYLEGRYYWNRRSPQALEHAIASFERAIQADPRFALAYDGLADAYSSQCLISDVPPAEVLPKAKAAAVQALELDSDLAEAHTSLAYLKFWYDWDWNGAEAEFRRALVLNPGYATAHQWYAEYLRLMGRQPEAIVEDRKALELDPLSLIINMESGLPYYLEHSYDEAERYYRKTLQMDPNFGLAHCVLGWSHLEKKRYPEAIAELEKARQLDDSSAVLASLGRAYAEAGRKHKAAQVLAELQRRSKSRYVSPYFFAMIYIGLGQSGQAIDSLESAYQKHDWVIPWINVGPMMDPIRAQARFVALLRRLSFPGNQGPQSE